MHVHEAAGLVAVANLLARLHHLEIDDAVAGQRGERRGLARGVAQRTEQRLEQQRQRVFAADVASDVQQPLGGVIAGLHARRVQVALGHHGLQKRVATRQRDLGSTRDLAVDHGLPHFGKEVYHVEDAYCCFHIHENIIDISIMRWQ
jgi:hypothetical protein